MLADLPESVETLADGAAADGTRGADRTRASEFYRSVSHPIPRSRGLPYTSRDLLREISAVSPAPIYSIYDTYLGYGIAAGIVESYNDLGRMIAEHLVQLAAGGSVPALSEGPNLCAADAQALRKWSLDEGRLPEDCDIRFTELSFWHTYPLQIFGALAVVIFQGALIAWLLFERHRRKRAAEQMQKARVETANREESRIWHVCIRSAKCRRRSTRDQSAAVAIKNYAVAARRRLAAGATAEAAKVEELLDKIEVQASRAGDVLHSLRAMVKKHEFQKTIVEVGELVADALKLVELESRDAEHPD